MERQPHTGYDGVLGFFNMTSLKTRRKYLNLNFLFKLINNEIDFTLLLEKINFKINPKNTRDNNLFFIKSKHSNYSINFPANMLMSLGNSTNLDFFYCNINDIKHICNFI